jgi:hypothetical protein
MRRAMSTVVGGLLLAASSAGVAEERFPEPGTTVAFVASGDGTLSVYDVASHTVIRERALGGRSTSLALGGSTLFALLPDDGAVAVYDFRAHEVVHALDLPPGEPTSSRFLTRGGVLARPDGSFLRIDPRDRRTLPFTYSPAGPALVAPIDVAEGAFLVPDGIGGFRQTVFVLDGGTSQLVSYRADATGTLQPHADAPAPGATLMRGGPFGTVVVAGPGAPQFLSAEDLSPVEGAADADLGETVDMEIARDGLVYVLNAAFAPPLPGVGPPAGEPSIDVYTADGAYQRSIGLGAGGAVRALALDTPGTRGIVVRDAGDDAGALVEVWLATGAARAPVPVGGDPRDVLVADLPEESWMPGFVRLDLGRAGRGRVLVLGAVDTGDPIDIFLERPDPRVTVASGGWSATFALEHDGHGLWRSADPSVDFSLRVRDAGSSTASLRCAFPHAAAEDKRFDGAVAFNVLFANGPMCLGIAQFEQGKLDRRSGIGRQVFPHAFPTSFESRRSETGPGLVHLRGGFATDGTVPDTLGPVSVSLGSVRYEIDGGAFRRHGAVFRYRDRRADPQSVTLDFGRGTFELRGHRQYLDPILRLAIHPGTGRTPMALPFTPARLDSTRFLYR